MLTDDQSPSLLRSALYVPLTNARAREKALSLPTDALIFDLEDSVAGEEKTAARKALSSLQRPDGIPSVLRVNAADQPDHVDDVMAAMAAGIDAILLPKVRKAGEIETLRRVMGLSGTRRHVDVWAMIETPQAVLALPDIAAAIGPSGVLVLGLNDLAKETGMQQVPGRLPMLPILTQAVIAARAAGCRVLDAVFNGIKDTAGFETEAQQARAFGFDGKTVIHPTQIAAANRIFGPTPEEIAEAQAIVTAFALPENAGLGVIQVEGRMVEILHRDMALSLLAKARQIALRERPVAG
jgi:citrate lyase subunit beta / citryl-CoA lyase